MRGDLSCHSSVQDGNSRLSRVLTTLLLLQTGHNYVPYASHESVIEENKDLYYKTMCRPPPNHLKGDELDWKLRRDTFWECQKVENILALLRTHDRRNPEHCADYRSKRRKQKYD